MWDEWKERWEKTNIQTKIRFIQKNISESSQVDEEDRLEDVCMHKLNDLLTTSLKIYQTSFNNVMHGTIKCCYCWQPFVFSLNIIIDRCDWNMIWNHRGTCYLLDMSRRREFHLTDCTLTWFGFRSPNLLNEIDLEITKENQKMRNV